MSEILADAGIAHTVCVATEYGEIVMREQTESTKAMQTAGQPIVNLHCGRICLLYTSPSPRDRG